MSDLTEQPHEKSSFTMNMVRWWEKKRLLFNLLIVSITTLILTWLWEGVGPFISGEALIFDTFWMIVWCNILYTIGWAGGILRDYYLKADPFSNTGRWLLFAAGTIFTVLVIEFRISALINPVFFEGV